MNEVKYAVMRATLDGQDTLFLREVKVIGSLAAERRKVLQKTKEEMQASNKNFDYLTITWLGWVDYYSIKHSTKF